MLALLSYLIKNNKSDVERKNPETSNQMIVISDSEDIKGLGYSGQNKLVSNSKGQIFTTYRKKVNEQYSVFVSKLIIENGQLKAEKGVNVSNPDENLASQRVGSLFVDSKDNIHLVWYGENENGNSGRQIKYAKSNNNGETWTEPIVISTVEGFNKEDLWQEHPSVIVDSEGIIYIAWEGKDKTHSSQQIKFSKSADGIIWSDWKNILPNNSSQSRPNILVNSKGDLFVLAYSRSGLENQQIWFTKSADKGESWSDWQRVSSSGTDARHVDAATDNNDNIHITWRQGEENKKSQIYYSKYSNKEDFSKPLKVAPSNVYQFFPQIGLGKKDEIYISWIETDKKSNYPEDDPETGDSYITSKSSPDINFKPKTIIEKKALYPNLWLTSLIDGATMVVFSELKQNSFPVVGKIMNLL